jgi:hypothetical protein
MPRLGWLFLVPRWRGSTALLALTGCTDQGVFADTASHEVLAPQASASDTDYEEFVPEVVTPIPPSIERIQRGLVAVGEFVTLEVVVNSPAHPSGFFVSDGRSGPWSGLWVSGTADVSMGDLVRLQGVVAEAGEGPSTMTRTELTLAVLEVIGSAELPEPVVLSVSELAVPDVLELYEAVVVTLAPAAVTGRTREGVVVLEYVVGMSGAFVPLPPSWFDVGTSFVQVTGPLLFNAGRWSLFPRTPDDMPRAPATLGDCIPVQGYALCKNETRWFPARRNCARKGGRLVVLETQDENLEVGQLMRQFHDGAFFIGLSDVADEDDWRWIDGTELAYDPWAGGEPNNAGNGEDCVHSNWRGDGEWNDIACGSRQPYVCEFPPDNQPQCERDSDCEAGPGACVEGSCAPE